MKGKLLFFLLMLILTTFSACTVTDGTEKPFDATIPSKEPPVGSCPAAATGTKQLIDAAQGICFLFPDEYDVSQGTEDAFGLHVQSPLNTEAPLALINFEAANGRSLDDVTKQRLADYAFEETQPQSILLGGQAAVMLDNLPGQDTNRRMFIIHNDTVIDLMIARIGEDYGEVGAQAEALYEMIITSFAFIPTVPGAPRKVEPAAPANQSTPPPTAPAALVTTAVPSVRLGTPQMLGRGRIVDATFTPDGTGVAVAWANGVSFTAVDPTNEQWFQSLPAAPVAIDMRADGRAAAVALADGSVVEFVLSDSRYITYPVAYDNAYWGDIAYASDGSQIAVQFIGPNRADPIYLLDTVNGSVSEVPKSLGNENTEPYLVWSPEGTAITLSSLMEDCAQILDVQTGERLFAFQHPDGCYSSYAAAWSPDGRFLTLSSPSNTIDTIEFANQTVSKSIPGEALSFQPSKAGQPLFYSPDGRWLASKGGFGFYGDSYPLQVWEAETGRQVGQMDLFRPNHRLVSSFAGETLVSLYTDGTLTRWSFTDDGPGDEEVVGQLPVYVVGYQFVWSPDGRKIAAPNDNQFIIWDVASAQPQAIFDIIYEAPTFSPDSRFVALTNRDTNELIIYDLDNDTVKQTFTAVTARGAGVAFAPDGRSLAYCSGNQVIVVDVETGVETAVLSGYPADQSITRIIWSPTGSALLAASGVTSGEEKPGTMILWHEADTSASSVRDDGTYRELFRAENVRSAYAVSTRPIALFNPSGSLIALENLPRAEVGQFTIFVYDLQAEELIMEFPDYQLSAWETNELLLTSEEQYDTRLTQWYVRTGESEVGQANDNGGLAFAPTGGFYAQANTTGPALSRGVELRHWQSNQLLAQVPLGSDTMQIEWSPDGRLLAATAADGTLTLLPVFQGEN